MNQTVETQTDSSSGHCVRKIGTDDRTLLHQKSEQLIQIQNSYAYRVGRILVDGLTSYRDFFKIPFRLLPLAKDVLAYKVTGGRSGLGGYVQLIAAEYEVRGAPGAVSIAERLVKDQTISSEFRHRVLFDLLRKKHFHEALAHAREALRLNKNNVKLISFLVDKANADLSKKEFDTALSCGQLLADIFSPEAALPSQDDYHRIASSGLSFPLVTRTQEGRLRFAEEAGLEAPIIAGWYEQGGLETIEQMLQQALNSRDFKPLEMKILVFQALRSYDSKLALQYGEEVLTHTNNLKFAKMLSDFHRHCGNLTRGYELISNPDFKGSQKRGLSMLKGQLELLQNGFPPAPPSRELSYIPSKTVFYLLHNALPFTSGGYATRAHGLLTGMVQQEGDVRGVTRMGFPLDLKKNGAASADEYEVIDGVTYQRLLSYSFGYGDVPLPEYLKAYSRALLNVVQEARPRVLHAASNFMNGAVANDVARTCGIPSIYEVRGLWEVTRLSRQPEWEGSDFYRMQVKMETEACMEATAVVTITTALKEEMVRRGVPEDKITVIHNGADPDRFIPAERDNQLEAELGVKGKTVIGYIGSIVDYEGLEYLIEAASLLKQKRSDFKVVIVGDGAVWQDLQVLAKDLNVEDVVLFTGRVPHHEVERYYSLIDIAPYPRKGLPVCEMVSPMKPFEAMCMEKAIISSDVHALTEIVNDGVTGLLHEKDNVQELASKLEVLLDSPELRRQLGSQARAWVKRERDWRVLSKKFLDLYAAVEKNGDK